MEYNTEKKWYEKKWMLIAAILIGIILIPIITYSLKFYDHGFSKNPEDWALFGDYIGGTTNLILGTLNITATIVLAFIIKNLDDSRSKQKDKEEALKHKNIIELNKLRHEEALELQKNIFNFKLKHEEYMKFQKQYSNVIFTIKTEVNPSLIIKKLIIHKNKTRMFLNSKRKLFPFLDDHYDVIKLYDTLIDEYENGQSYSIDVRDSEKANNLINALENIDFNIIDFLNKTY